jgi:hypothetical protein
MGIRLDREIVVESGTLGRAGDQLDDLRAVATRRVQLISRAA